jgi:hypothetical protein
LKPWTPAVRVRWLSEYLGAQHSYSWLETVFFFISFVCASFSYWFSDYLKLVVWDSKSAIVNCVIINSWKNGTSYCELFIFFFWQCWCWTQGLLYLPLEPHPSLLWIFKVSFSIS